MNWKGSQGAEARLSAREAVKIRAALAESVNTLTMYEAYLSTSPHSTGNLAQDRARARAWAIINVRVNLEAVKLVLLRIWATGYLIGELSADEIYAQARQAQKSAMITKKETPPARAIGMEIDWDSWTPGDQVTAAMLKPPKALRRLLDASGVTIKGINNTTLNDIGNALGESVALGLAPKQAAKLIRQSIASPARALTISITEMRRAVSTTTIERYKSFGLTQMRWVTFTPCDKCEMNDQVVANIGAPFPSGDTQTPAHPNCQCRLAPVIPGDPDASSTAGQVTEIQAPEPVAPVMAREPVIPVAGEWWNGWVQQSNDKYVEDVVDRLQELNPSVDRFTLKKYVLLGKVSVQDRQIANSGFIIRKGDLETRFYGPGAALTEKERQEVLTFVEGLQATNPIKELKLNIGSTSEGKLGWAVLGGKDMWITPKTAKNNKPNLEAGGSHKMPVLRTRSQRDYTLAHEWGHLISPAEKPGYLTKQAENAIMRISNEFPNEFTSQYSGTNFKEFYAEMFAEWYLSSGLTTNKIVQEMAKEFQWKV